MSLALLALLLVVASWFLLHVLPPGGFSPSISQSWTEPSEILSQNKPPLLWLVSVRCFVFLASYYNFAFSFLGCAVLKTEPGPPVPVLALSHPAALTVPPHMWISLCPRLALHSTAWTLDTTIFLSISHHFLLSFFRFHIGVTSCSIYLSVLGLFYLVKLAHTSRSTVQAVSFLWMPS